MENDFLKSLGFLGVTARLKRLNDKVNKSIKELYKYYNLDIEPSWHLVFLILKENKNQTLKEIADTLKLSQPAMTKMVNRMIKKGYLTLEKDNLDNRKKILKLTKKTKLQLPFFEKIWTAGQHSIEEILIKNTYFLESLSNFENKINEISFKDRVIYYMNNKNK